uniref:RRM domain-containing protein n=1 Tax=Globodera pallida TaxID=36090 RepID=A0A183BWE2_GLOPA
MDFNTPSRRSVASTNLRFGGTVHKPRWEKELEQKLQDRPGFYQLLGELREEFHLPSKEVVDELLQNQQKTNVDEESGGYVKPISFDLFKELICAEGCSTEAPGNLSGVSLQDTSAQDEKNEDATPAAFQERVRIRDNDARLLFTLELMCNYRSSVIVLPDMAVKYDGIDEFRVENVENEIREEYSKYGQVTDVVMVQEIQSPHTVKIFVRFVEPLQAEEARIDGRFFDGRTVVSQSYDPYQTVFGHDDLRG